MSSSVGKKPVPVYLRGLPPELVREAKAIAARRGVTLASFVAESLARAISTATATDAESAFPAVRSADNPLTHSAPVAPVAPVVHGARGARGANDAVKPLSQSYAYSTNSANEDERDRDHDVERELSWYESNCEQLARQYSDEFVAIIDNRVVDHDAVFEALAERMFAAHGERSIFMPKVRTWGHTAHLRSPRIARPA